MQSIICNLSVISISPCFLFHRPVSVEASSACSDGDSTDVEEDAEIFSETDSEPDWVC